MKATSCGSGLVHITSTISFLSEYSDVNDYGSICEGIAVFVFFQRWFISGIQLGAVKG